MIRFEHVYKSFGRRRVLDDINLHVRRGTLFVMCGESGAGKSTLLATVNGLEPISGGRVYIDGMPLASRPRELRLLRRQIGVVFQSYNLFGHMTVVENVTLALERSLGLSREESTSRAREHLDRIGLITKADAYPSEISGGEQQRAAIARCMAMRPKILLMDEPTAALDIDNAAMVIETIRSLKGEGITILLATHQIVAFAPFADEVACMKDGRITESGTVEELHLNNGPDSKIVAWLTGGHGRAGDAGGAPGLPPQPAGEELR